MEKQIYYKRIDINGDESKLPKEDGTYIVHDSYLNSVEEVSCEKLRAAGITQKEFFKRAVDWYLQPCETTALFKDYYPKEFVEWKDFGGAAFFVIKHDNKWWCKDLDKFLTNDDLFTWWFDNVRDK